MDPVLAALGLPAPGAAPAASAAAPGASFDELPPQMRAAVLADAQKTGAQSFTVNGKDPMTGNDKAPPRVDPVIAALGLNAGAMPAPVVPAAPAEVPQAAQRAPATPGYAPGTVAQTNPAPDTPEPKWWEKGYAGFQAAANAAASAIGGGAGMTYGALEALGENATRRLAGETPRLDVEQNAMARARQFTPTLPAAAQTPLGQEYTESVGDTLARHGPSIIAIGPLLGELGHAMQVEPAYRVGQTGAAADRTVQGVQAAFDRLKGQSVEPAPAPPLTGTSSDFRADPLPSSGALNTPEAARRQAVLESVGLQSARRSALTGDALAGSTDAQAAKLDSPEGALMRAQLDAEKAALANHADGLVRATGGSQGLDQSTLYGRGNSIVAPLDALGDLYDAKTKALYATAAERAQGVPTDLGGFRAVLGDDSQLTNADRVHLRSAVNSYAKSLGMVGEDGQVFSNAQQAETMRQYLKENWSPQNAGFVKKLTSALDEDVFKSAGEDVYGEARKMWAEKKNTLDNPNGIAKIMDASGPSGINRAVPIEKVPDAVTGMPVAQFGHIVDTLKNSPAEIQPQAAQALAEIKAQFANKVQAIGTSQQGQWNAKGVNQYLQNNAARMSKVFEPEEIAAFRNLNDAGNILAKDQSYPGAAVQAHNLVRAGVTAGLGTLGGAAGATVGGTLFGPYGAAVGGSAGSFLGGKVGVKLGEGAAMRAAKRRIVPLGTPLSQVGKP